MKTNLAYIDTVMDRAVEAERIAPNIPDKDQKAIVKTGQKVIGGFRVRDEAAERQALDEMIAKRRKTIDQFREDREAVRGILAKLGVTPLAVCPTGAWYKLCAETWLFVLQPDKDARVGISRKAFEDYSEKTIDKQTEKDWSGFLTKLFPKGQSPANADLKATLVLPDPPADVADILCKVQELTLTVAAVGDAIRLAEKPSDLMKAANTNPKDLWAQQQGYEDYQDWLKRDPIIFTEHGSAAAIVAQFGDFPIEQAVVDALIKTDSLLAKKPNAAKENVTSAPFNTVEDVYGNQLEALMRRQMAQRQIDWERNHTIYRGLINSRDWTG